MDKTISVRDLLVQVAGDLEQIEVPVRYGDRIARPLCLAVAQIRMCIDAIRDEPDESQAPEAGQEEDENNG